MLKFDPYRWIAERDPEAAPVATLAGLAMARPETEIAELGQGLAKQAKAATPSDWRAGLASLNLAKPPDGLEPERWGQLLVDARWLARWHGEAASALGWTASDLFGLDATRWGWGGLADRLAGARHVALTDTVAHWRAAELDGWLWRRSLRPMALLWETACHE